MYHDICFCEFLINIHLSGMQVGISYFASICHRPPLNLSHERTFYIDHVIPVFSYFGNETGLLDFSWCEKTIEHRNHSTVSVSSWNKGTAKLADGLRSNGKRYCLIMECSSNGSSEDVAHIVDDTVRQIESTTGALKLELMKNLSASLETIKRRKILGVQCIVDKITLTSTSLNDREVYKVLELRSALIPVRWNERKKLVKFFELMATVQIVLLEQSRVSDDLEDELAGLTVVLPEGTVRSKLLSVNLYLVDILLEQLISNDLEGEMAGLTAVLLEDTVRSKLIVSIKYVDI